MGELLCGSRGAIQSSLPSCSCRAPCPWFSNSSRLDARESSFQDRFEDLDAQRLPSRTSFPRGCGRGYQTLSSADGCSHGKDSARLGGRAKLFSGPNSRKVGWQRFLARKRINRAATKKKIGSNSWRDSRHFLGNSSTFVDLCDANCTDRLLSTPCFPVAFLKSCGIGRECRKVAFYPVNGADNADFQPELNATFNTRPAILGSFLRKAEIPPRLILPGIHNSHVETKGFIVHAKPKPWWKQVLFQQLSEDDFDDDGPDDSGDEGGDSEDVDYVESRVQIEDPEDEDDIDDLLADDRRYFSWQQKKQALDELREYQESGRDPDSKDWEDWLDDSWGDHTQYLPRKADNWFADEPDWEKGGLPREPPRIPERGMNRTIKELLLRIFETQEEVEDDLTFEERIFRFTSRSTAKFITILILVPWLIDIVVHDFAVVPFLRRWVEEVPLASKILDLRESQKLYMIDRLKLERQRVRFESEIGKAPPLSETELNEHIREEALELREEFREENRRVFANIWSDAVAGFTIFLLLVFNPQQVSIMKLTGDRIFTNISDTGKAFIIILCTDIFLGYHSESGWETIIEILLDHYGLETSQGAIYLFVATVPVTIDAIFKLWVFRYLSKLSPSAAATFREMKRH